MCSSKSEVQKAFELHYLQQMKELKKAEKEYTLDALDFYICDALSECDYVKNNLIVSEPNIDDIYEHISLTVKSIESATRVLKEIQNLINADEF